MRSNSNSEIKNRKNSYHQNLPKNIDTPIIFDYRKKLDPEENPEQKILLLPFWHEELEIKYYIIGGAEVNCDSNCFLTKPGDLVIINPFEYHSTRVFNENEIPEYHLMNIDLSHPSLRTVFTDNPEFINAKTNNKLPFFINVINNPDSPCLKLFLILAEEYHKNGPEFTPYKENLLRSFLYSLIENAVNPDHPENLKTLNSTAVYLVPALQYIDDHFNENISLGTLSNISNLSVSRFSHLFKEITGVSAIQYLNDLRVSKATMYLNTSNLSINDIAVKTGFEDAAYFSRIFKKSTGLSPSDYRKKQKLSN